MNAPNLLIHKAVNGDICDLLRLESASFVSSDGLLTERAFRYHIKRGNLCLIAREKVTGQLAGYVLVLPHRKSARIYSLATSARLQGKGVARSLMYQAMEEIRKRNIPLLKLEVRRENTPAIALYQSMGFHIQRIRQNYYGANEDAICMQIAST
jgi:[ribosomal protein S18]-alanine N-acetyltransferase